MAIEESKTDTLNSKSINFFDYWDSLGFFDNIQLMLPDEFFILFEIARNIFTDEASSDALGAIDEMTRDERIRSEDRDADIKHKRLERTAPLGNKMDIDKFKNITELKKALPRELALDETVFDIKLFTKSLLIRKFYESDSDRYSPISTIRDQKGKEANRFEQKFYILLDRSRSMEQKMRSFYSKCIVAEFLRRKFKSNAKLYYRPFDSDTGRLFRVGKQKDFPELIRRVLHTVTGGTSTNLQGAVCRAVNDIQYDKDMMNTEILVVTDGISRINKYEMKKILGDIKLNVLKIGDEFIGTDYFDIKSALDNANITVDLAKINLRNIRNIVKKINANSLSEPMSVDEQKAYRFISSYMESIFMDLREVSNRFIEVKDLNRNVLFKVTDAIIENLRDLVSAIESEELSKLSVNEKSRLYKKAYFLSQYIGLIIENQRSEIPSLKELLARLVTARQNMLKDPELLFTVMKIKGYHRDRHAINLARKEIKEAMKNMELNNKSLSIKDIKKAELILSPEGAGEGDPGKFILVILIKLFQMLKRTIYLPLKVFRRRE